VQGDVPVPLPERTRPRVSRRRTGLAAAAIVLAVVVLPGCAVPGYRDAIDDLAAMPALASDARVRHEPGAEAYAERVAALLPDAIRQVERGHYRAFARTPVVYVCGTEACFDKVVARRLNLTAAVVYDNRLVLAPRLHDREPERLRPILVHELSHLHFGQRLGHYTQTVPVWFHEGLASLVAEGGGADLVTDAEARSAAGAGRHFLPDEQHLPWQRKMAGTWQLPISVFYRQALLFVTALRARDEQAFRRLLLALQDGQDFDAAFAEAYGRNPANAGRAYFSGPYDAAAAPAPARTAP